MTANVGDARNISIQLAVADVGTTQAFYAGILELPVQRSVTTPGAPEYLALEQDGCSIIFVEESAVLKNHPVLEEQFSSYPKGVGMTLHFRVEGIDDIYDAILDEELEVLYPLEEKPYGMKELWCFDPDGYLLVLEEPVKR